MKQWFQSKLVWVGLIQIAIAVLTSFSEWFAKGVFTVDSVTLFVAGVLTIILRIAFTNTAIGSEE